MHHVGYVNHVLGQMEASGLLTSAIWEGAVHTGRSFLLWANAADLMPCGAPAQIKSAAGGGGMLRRCGARASGAAAP